MGRSLLGSGNACRPPKEAHSCNERVYSWYSIASPLSSQVQQISMSALSLLILASSGPVWWTYRNIKEMTLTWLFVKTILAVTFDWNVVDSCFFCRLHDHLIVLLALRHLLKYSPEAFLWGFLNILGGPQLVLDLPNNSLGFLSVRIQTRDSRRALAEKDCVFISRNNISLR